MSGAEFELCRFCSEKIYMNTNTGKWETDDDMLSHCAGQGEIKEAYIHQPPPPPKGAEPTVSKPPLAQQGWVWPWLATRQPPATP